ncbi:MAG TPA: hypothetical protein PLJ26_00605 [Candidatus Omnitrophota bacterium]|nr:hypothetical protein [Candidatus Omnitrophota bacterium]
MKEIVERILKQERQAQEIIEKTRRESDGLIQQARKEAQEIISRSAQDVAAALENKRQAAQQEFRRQKDLELGRLRGEVSEKIAGREGDIPAIAQRLFNRIISIEE